VGEQDSLKAEDLKFSYQGKEYSHLYLYRCTLENVGGGNIENQSIIVPIPEEVKLIDSATFSAPVEHEIDYQIKDAKAGKEHSWKIARF